VGVSTDPEALSSNGVVISRVQYQVSGIRRPITWH
jgi:hypothetical protein